MLNEEIESFGRFKVVDDVLFLIVDNEIQNIMFVVINIIRKEVDFVDVMKDI